MNTVVSARRSAAGLALAVVFTSSVAAQGQAPGLLAPTFRVDRWTTENGLPGMSVTAMQQGPDGFLWIIASGTVVRFDGLSFERLDGATTGLSGFRPRSVLPLPGDTLVILGSRVATDSSSVTRMVGDRVVDAIEFPGTWVDLARDRRGALWLRGRDGAVARLDAGGISRPVDSRVLSPVATSEDFGRIIATDRFGDVWVRDFSRDSIGRITGDGVQFTMPAVSDALVVRPSTHDILVAARTGRTVTIRDPGGERLAEFIADGRRTARLVDRSGRLWVSTPDGLEAFTATSTTPIARVPLRDVDAVDEVIEDSDGNLWVRTPTQGLYRVREQPVVVLGRDNGIGGPQVLQVVRGKDRSMLLTDWGGGAWRVHDGTLSAVADRGIPVWPVPIEEDSRGTVWTMWNDGAVPDTYHLRGRGPGVSIDAAVPERVGIIREDSRHDGTLWAAGRNVYHLRPDARNGLVLLDSFVVGNDATRGLTFDAQGALWVTSPAGLIRILEGRREVFTDSLLLGRRARSAFVDPSGAIWVGTYGEGLVRFKDGAFRRVTEEDGLGENVASALIADDAGNLWMAGNRSVHRASLAQLNAFADGTTDHVNARAYTQADGIPNPETSGWPAARDADGRLWFPTFDGAVVIDPVRAIALDAEPPRVVIGHVRSARGAIPQDSVAERTVRIAAGERRFEIDYTAIALRDPGAVRFRYRLDGFDDSWNDAGTSRTATYTGVRGGHYTFRVQAIKPGGVMSTSDATLTVIVTPLFTQTVWFLALALAGVAGLGYLGARWRLRAVLHRQAELDRLVAERTAMLTEQTAKTERALTTVAEQADTLRALDAARSRMFSNVSHEFRTPLTLIVGPLRDLKAGRLGELPAAARAEIDVVLQSSERLNALVEELLDVARLEAGELRLQRQEGDIVAFLRRVSRGFEALARARRIGYTVSLPDESIPMAFDPARLEKVMNNLLGNAFKFTGEGGSITLSAAREDAAIRITVTDTGIGIPAEALARVFDRFYQVDDSSRRRHPGAGVGLALAREFVELHGGTVEATSVEGEGSTFVVRLPVTGSGSGAAALTDDDVAVDAAVEPAPDATLTSVPDVPDDSPTVLVVEDNAGLRAWLVRHLEASYRVVEAVDGAAGLEVARRVEPDVVVSDVMMPNMDGQELLEAIRADASIAWLPVILLTAKASHESRLDGLRSGADDYITKPFDVDELLLRVQNLIASRRRLRDRLTEAQRIAPTLRPPVSQQEQAAKQFVADVQRVIEAHLDDEDFNVDAMAAAVNMSRSSLYRRAQEVLGRPPMDVVWESRLDVAARWLRETDVAVNEIAYGVGFKSVPHFSRKFRERFGVSPSGWRAEEGRGQRAEGRGG